MAPLLSVLGIAQRPGLVADHMDVDAHERMQQREEQLRQEMARLQHHMEQRSQGQSRLVQGALLFAALQQWQLWAFARLLILLFGLCWWLRRRSCEPGSGCKQRSFTRMRKEEEEEEVDISRVWADCLQWPAPYMTNNCKVVEELVDELLGACRRLSRNTFKPWLQPAVSLSCLYEGWSAQEDNILYRLLMPL